MSLNIFIPIYSFLTKVVNSGFIAIFVYKCYQV